VRVLVAVLRLPPEMCRLTRAAKRAKGHAQLGDELVIVVGAYRRCERVDLLADYRLRWGIESLFGAIKSRGFDLESTHLHQIPCFLVPTAGTRCLEATARRTRLLATFFFCA
jgi:hypothetical protein